MDKVIAQRASSLTYDQFVQETVLQKIASDVYNEAKNVTRLRHVGVRKTKLIFKPVTVPSSGEPSPASPAPSEPAPAEVEALPRLPLETIFDDIPVLQHVVLAQPHPGPASTA